MKGTFTKERVSLSALEETLNQHEPYSVLAVSTTGLNNSNFNEHCATRVVLKTYEFNNELGKYTTNPALSLDKQVAATPEAIAEAEKNVADYDVFKGAGIDVAKYKAGENVIPAEEFANEFLNRTKELSNNKTMLIINGGLDFVKPYLNKISENLTNPIEKLNLEGKVLNQTNLTKDYFSKNKIEAKATLENLFDKITPHPSNTFTEKLISNEDLLNDFNNLNKDDFLAKHSEISKSKYDRTKDDIEKRQQKIEGTDNRVNVINQFIASYGQDIKALESDYMQYMREATVESSSQLSQRGKESYRNSPISDKLDILVRKGTIDPEAIYEKQSDYDNLMLKVKDKSNKGVIFIHAASTGFDFKAPVPKNTGEPIQFTAVMFARNENGEISFSPDNATGMTLNIACSRNGFLKAESNALNGTYDTFKETGIDIEKYKQALAEKGIINAKSSNQPNSDFVLCDTKQATQYIKKFFDMYNPKDYPIIAAGGTNKSDVSFAQTCISNIGNFSFCSAPYVDFAQAVKDYTYIQDTSSGENVLFNPDDMVNRNFSLTDIGTLNSIPSTTTSDKCLLMAEMTSRIEYQERSKEANLFTEKAEEANKAPVAEIKAPATEVKAPVAEAKVPEENTSLSSNELDEETEKLLLEEMGVDDSLIFDENSEEMADIIRELGKPNIKDTLEKSVAPDIKTTTAVRNISKTSHERKEPEKPRSFNRKFGDDNNQRSFTNRQGNYTPPDKQVHISEPNQNVDVNKLLDIINSQNTLLASMNDTNIKLNETIIQQNQMLSEVNTKLIKALEDNRELMYKMIEHTNEKVTDKAPFKVSQVPKGSQADNTVVYIENIKEDISCLGENLSPKAVTSLSKANEALSEVQKEIINENKRVIPFSNQRG